MASASLSINVQLWKSILASLLETSSSAPSINAPLPASPAPGLDSSVKTVTFCMYGDLVLVIPFGANLNA